MNEEEYLESLKGFYKGTYLQFIKEEIQKVNKEFDEIKEHTLSIINKEIENSIAHDILLNMCIFPFIQRGHITERVGYRFFRAEPLFELEIQNLDFLIYNLSSKVAIFGEVKSSISNSSQVVKEFKERINKIEENMDYIIKEYLGEKPKLSEFVLGVYSISDQKLVKTISNSGGGIIVWSADRFFKRLSLKTYMSEKDAIKQGIIHKDRNLRKALYNQRTELNQYNLFPSSHIINYLRLIISAREYEESIGWYVTMEKLDKELIKEMPYLHISSKFIREKSELIIRLTEQIGFIHRTDTLGQYKLIHQISNPRSLEKNLNKLYEKFKLEEKKKAYIDNSLKRAKERLEEFKKSRPDLDSYA